MPCWGKAPRPIAQLPTKEEQEREGLSREEDRIEFVDFRFERTFWDGRESKTLYSFHVL